MPKRKQAGRRGRAPALPPHLAAAANPPPGGAASLYSIDFAVRWPDARVSHADGALVQPDMRVILSRALGEFFAEHAEVFGGKAPEVVVEPFPPQDDE